MPKKQEHLLEGKGMEIYKIFLKDWYSLKEASKEYNPEFMKTKKGSKHRSHPTVSRYFSQFQENGWLNSKYITKYFDRKSKLGKLHKKSDSHTRWKANLNPFFEYIEKKYDVEFSNTEKRILNLIFLEDISGYKEKILESEDILITMKDTLPEILSQSLNYYIKPSDYYRPIIENEKIFGIKIEKLNAAYSENIDEDSYYWLRLELEKGKWKYAKIAMKKIGKEVLIYSLPYTFLIKICKICFPPEIGKRILHKRIQNFKYPKSSFIKEPKVNQEIIKKYEKYTKSKLS